MPINKTEIAQSFGLDPERYDRARPSYPPEMIDRIAGGTRDLLDVGIGTGIAARQFRDAGCRVLGVEPDARMAAVARSHGFEVEESRFEEWEPRGRTFDTVAAGQTWHWVDPEAGARRAHETLRPGGRLALFWNTVRSSPELASTFSEVYRRTAPSLPFDPWAVADPYGGIVEKVAGPLAGSGRWTDVEVWRFGWEHEYSRDAWLDQVRTAGGHRLLPPAELKALLDGLGEVIGEQLTVPYETVAITTTRE
ncbi:MAG TPA: class I SAM-dependent methyltransferase [Actinoplanes sp.]|nr:class I SAM-dependent methyltransferase [Actinoplanes sp.]